VQQALDEIEGGLPFRLLGVDSNNGSEFINWHLKHWCEQKQIQLTRGLSLQEKRQCPRGAEELDARAQASGLGTLRFASGGGGHQRFLPESCACG
jgi:hypothetical protein